MELPLYGIFAWISANGYGRHLPCDPRVMVISFILLKITSKGIVEIGYLSYCLGGRIKFNPFVPYGGSHKPRGYNRNGITNF